MGKKITRRSFLKNGAVLGASSLLLYEFPNKIYASPKMYPEISVVSGADYYKNTIEAVASLGGMKKYVGKGSKVAVLANPQRPNPGAFTSPLVVSAVINMCLEAGASSVTFISWLPVKSWESTGLKTAVEKSGGKLDIVDLRDESCFKTIPVPEGKVLKEAKVMKKLFDHDLLINIPVTKDHLGNKFTGTMKNLMGLNSPKSNRTFHKSDWKTNRESIIHLDQSIADLNTIITPALSVVDATEFIITNGPFGPGELIKPKKVIAGTDRIAIDSYCCQLWGLKPEDIVMIKKGFEHGLGKIDLSGVKISEITL
ncbi:MAG: DUF362 domain-containing protein [Candidatus Aminicenantes bacterium]|nr:DUF362 domain-containing protein [Candidatus Aminicenantes bacterium]